MKPFEEPKEAEVESVRVWLRKNEATLPKNIYDIIRRVFIVYYNLCQPVGAAKRTLTRLREAMGILPRSEKGRVKKVPDDLDDSAQSEVLNGLIEKRDALLREKNKYDDKIRKHRPKPKGPVQMEFALESPGELMFCGPVSNRHLELSKFPVDRKKHFDRKRGLHMSFDKTKRIDLAVVVTEIECQIETVTDPATGRRIRASILELGPENFQFTWKAIGNLVKMHVGFAIPINRISLMIGEPEFSSSKICRALEYVATNLTPVYIQMFDELCDSRFLAGDDTSTRVLNLEDEPQKAEYKEIEDLMGWISPKANGLGDKKALNVSYISGRSWPDDPRSTIRIFRTHIGSTGNLLTKLMEGRKPDSGPLVFQGDLSTTNRPSKEMQEKFEFTHVGCGAHARRPFWRLKEEDPGLCYYILRGFAILAHIEQLIQSKGKTAIVSRKYRGRYARMIWMALSNRCVAATTGTIPGAATYCKDSPKPNIWPPGSDLHRACKYLLNNFQELTYYLDHPELEHTNNARERALRIEKCMLSGSKFRKTRAGRVGLDILRSLNATCTAAGVDISTFMLHCFKSLAQLRKNPENFTPFAVAKKLQK